MRAAVTLVAISCIAAPLSAGLPRTSGEAARIRASAEPVRAAAPAPRLARPVSTAVYPPTSSPSGKSYAAWTQEFWKWLMAIPVRLGPILDSTGAHCMINQGKDVWFVGGPIGASVERECTVPAGVSLLVPAINYVNDYPCPDPSFEPAPGQTVEEFLLQGARGFIDLVTVAEIELDGVPLEVSRVEAGLFAFTAASDLVTLDPCATGSPQIGVTDGYWSFLRPLSPGHHVLHIHAEIPDFGLVNDQTLHLTVVK